MLRIGRVPARERNQIHYGLIRFLDFVSLYMDVGFDLSFAWHQAWLDIEALLPTRFAARLKFDSGGEGFQSFIDHLSDSAELKDFQFWFQLLAQHQRTGGPTQGILRAINDELRREWDRRLERHIRELPGKLGLALIVGFIPPALFWLMGPLVLELAVVTN